MTIGKILGPERASWLIHFILVFLVILTTVLSPGVGSSAPSVTVGILPVDTSEAAILGGLSQGVRSMLASRLSGEEGIDVLPPASVDRVLLEAEGGWRRDNLAPFFAPLDVAYLLSTKMRSSDLGWVIQVQLFHPFAPGHAAHTFDSAGTKAEQVVPLMSKLAHDIAIYLKDFEVKSAAEDSSGGPAATGISGDLVSFRTAHPERTNPDVITLDGAYLVDRPVFAMNLPWAPTAIDAGDVDGDGLDEIVLAGDSQIVVEDYLGKEVKRQAAFSLEPGVSVHSISVADLNENKKAEIYISAAADNMPCSIVLEWGVNGLEVLARSIPWYLRVLFVPGEGPVLVGQRFDGEESGVVVELVLQKDQMQAAEKIVLPRKVNLFDFSLADLDGDGKSEVVSLASSGHLMVHDQHGNLLWKGKDLFCGTFRTIGGAVPSDSLVPLFSPAREQLMVPSRIMVADFNHDGRSDVIVNKNPATLAQIFEWGKSYPSGVIVGLVWGDNKLREAWRTPDLEGPVVEYQVRPTLGVEAGESSGDNLPMGLFVGLGGDGKGADSGRLLLFEFELDWL